MKKSYLIYLFALLFLGCEKKNEFVISFGSCNNQNLENKLWEPILSHHPEVFIWGGDIIYSDTEDMAYMNANYNQLKHNEEYAKFKNRLQILGTWDDHDYGLNDGGANYQHKDSAQSIFLDFFDVPEKDPRRNQKGIYFAKDFEHNGNIVKIIVLDTRFFRSDLLKDPSGNKRYLPYENDKITMLGEAQWLWLEKQLKESKAQFNVIVSSIQFLSYEHGFETWGNMPLEVKKMENIIVNSKAKGILILSGDRHIAEISTKQIQGLAYPLVDFTSSGMTHSYESFDGEANKYRAVDVVSSKNFGLLKFNFDLNQVQMEIRGEGNTLFRSFTQKY